MVDPDVHLHHRSSEIKPKQSPSLEIKIFAGARQRSIKEFWWSIGNLGTSGCHLVRPFVGSISGHVPPALGGLFCLIPRLQVTCAGGMAAEWRELGFVLLFKKFGKNPKEWFMGINLW